ncbi:MAG: tetratricopeptide repeat protein [Halobacteria archaeon]|nr:tetratricopeptide repeat protein [Halobacteria archaeon]
MGMIENLEAMLEKGQDNALLRFSLGSALLGNGEAEQAKEHLAEAVSQDPEYSAAWKVYGKALQALGKPEDAMFAYESGIAAAERRGDKQAAKEMQVFLRRLQKAADS